MLMPGSAARASDLIGLEYVQASGLLETPWEILICSQGCKLLPF